MLTKNPAYPWAILRERGARGVQGRRVSLLLSLMMTAVLIYLLPGMMSSFETGDGNRMDERLRPAQMRTLTVWLMPGGIDDRKLLSEACAAFEKEQPGVRVFLRTVTAEEWTAPDAVLPDVALLATGSLNIPEKVLIPLAGMEEAGASGRSGGVTYALPLWLEANVLSLPAEWIEATSTAQPTASALLASPPPDKETSGILAPEDLPWRRLLEPGGLTLPEGVALQQLMFLCPVQTRDELAALGTETAGEAQARVCTLGEHLAAVRGGEARVACLLMPAVSDHVRYAALGRDSEEARAFVGMLASADWQARAAAMNMVPALEQDGAENELTHAALERFSQGMTLPNAFSHTAQEMKSLCLDAFLRSADPVETLLRLR